MICFFAYICASLSMTDAQLAYLHENLTTITQYMLDTRNYYCYRHLAVQNIVTSKYCGLVVVSSVPREYRDLVDLEDLLKYIDDNHRTTYVLK